MEDYNMMSMTVADLIAMLEKVDNKDSRVEFHTISNRAYQDTIVKVDSNKYTYRTTITSK
jgi:hypothetical protein